MWVTSTTRSRELALNKSGRKCSLIKSLAIFRIHGTNVEVNQQISRSLFVRSDTVSHESQFQSFGTTIATHQMLMVNPDKGRVFFRARLALGAGSAPDVREDILWEASKAYEALSR